MLQWHSRVDQLIQKAAKPLAEQYVSIAEAEPFERCVFNEELLQRAYFACIYDGVPPQTPHEWVERTSVGPNYTGVYPYMQHMLEEAFRQLST